MSYKVGQRLVMTHILGPPRLVTVKSVGRIWMDIGLAYQKACSRTGGREDGYGCCWISPEEYTSRNAGSPAPFPSIAEMERIEAENRTSDQLAFAEKIDNNRIRSAAPDLLAALEGLLAIDDQEPQGPSLEIYHEWLSRRGVAALKCHEAIAKARGK